MSIPRSRASASAAARKAGDADRDATSPQIAREDRPRRRPRRRGDRQQEQKCFRQPGQELARNVGARQGIGPDPLAPMRKLERHRDGREVHQRDPELLERIADLQPRPQRDGGEPGERRRRPRNARRAATDSAPSIVRARRRTPRAQDHGAEQIGVGDDAAGARCRWPARSAGRRHGRPPGRQHLPRHDQNGERRPRHRGEKRHVDRREEQAAVEVSGHQAERDGGQAGPAADRQPPDRQQCGHAGEPDDKRHRVPDREPVREIERLDIGREHVKPRPVVPEREFDGFEVGAVGEAAGVPGERLGAVIVGIELVDGDAVVGCGRKADHQHRAQQGGGQHDFGIDGKAPALRLVQRRKTYGMLASPGPLMSRATNVQAADWCHRSKHGKSARHTKQRCRCLQILAAADWRRTTDSWSEATPINDNRKEALTARPAPVDHARVDGRDYT